MLKGNFMVDVIYEITYVEYLILNFEINTFCCKF